MEKIIIIGGKGQAVVMADHILHAAQIFNAQYDLIGYSIDDPALGDNINGIPILCKINQLSEKYNHLNDVKYFFALYKPVIMKERIQLFKGLDLPETKFTNFVHPSSYIAPSASMGFGNFVCANVTINSNAQLGNHNILNGNVLFGHDSVIGNHNILAGNATISSELVIGNGNFIGLNSTLRDRVKMGDYNIVGMASTVLKNIGSNQTVVGSPAKLIK